MIDDMFIANNESELLCYNFFCLSGDYWQYYPRRMFFIVINRLRGFHKFGIFPKRMPSVGIPVKMREIAAGDGDPYPMTGFENMAGIHQSLADCELINLSR